MFATVFILLTSDNVFMTALKHNTLSFLEDGRIAHPVKQAGFTGTRPFTVSDYSPPSTALSSHCCVMFSHTQLTLDSTTLGKLD